ncbi:MAG: UDP-N-acetylglucosamine 1-carboxyvinyltransferase [Dehalococcoidia bacterium]|nr:UDP-N-acetylglucosamine 1-carboxyvinyltransferase [Dehalococcoidia bacterium]
MVLQNVPGISDVDSLSDLLQTVGATVTHEPGGVMRLNGGGVSTLDAPTELITENRASFQVMGPLLTRHGYAASAPPGGDVIGQRPLDVHLHGFEAMGASVAREGERFVVRRCGERLQGARIFMDYPSVSGTQNVLMAAVLADGESHIINAATEPEVQELCHLLNAMGAHVEGIGTQVLRIEGVEDLHGATIRIMPDRIEAGTWAVAAVMSGGDIAIEDAPVGVMDSVIEKLRATGGTVEQPQPGLLRATAEAGQLQAASFQALPYPGLATDLHAPMAALLTQASGVSIVHERVFDNRMLYVSELRKMGAEIVSTGSTAIVSGPTPLHGAHVRALDVRAGAAVLLAAIVASGQTVIDDIHHLDRGYDRLDEKLRSLGVELERI